MKILHLTPNNKGFEEATLISNRVSETNKLALISINGEEFMTGGFLIEDNVSNRAILDSVEPSKQHSLIKSIRTTPFTKMYQDGQ